jgi:hypothetical protein
MTVFATVDVGEPRFRKAESLLTQLPFEMRTDVVHKAIRAAAAPVEKMAKALAPDSIKTGTRLLWSPKLRTKRANTKQLLESIGHSTVREYGQRIAIFVGPLHPAGNLINAIGHPHKQILWGRPTGAVIPPVKFLQQAAQITASDQGAAFTRKFETEAKRILKKLGST